jgi:uncharacterized protein YlxW (UPF0749 family)
MKKITSQLILALVCILLGFMLTYKLKTISAKESAPESEEDKAKIKSRIEAINAENEKLEKENVDLMEKIKRYEENAASEGNTNKTIKEELDKSRMVLGIGEDVTGIGIRVSITPRGNLFADETEILKIEDRDLVYLVNGLATAGAEAISVNEKRITSQTGIRSSSGNAYILINDEKVSPSREIVIKAIGNTEKLEEVMKQIDIATHPALNFYEMKMETSDSIVIPSYNRKYEMSHMKPLKLK